MTSRPGNYAEELLRYSRCHHLAHLLTITRKDGEVLRVTDHDRQLTVDGETFRPILMGNMSAERREAALRSGDQEAQGVIDGSYVTIADLDGNAYLGAEVRQVVVDWTMPWLPLSAHRKWIRRVVRTGSTWTATLEGRTQQLQRPSAGRFGGTFSPKCPYELGGVYCKKDISQWTQVNALIDRTATNGTALTLVDSGLSLTTDQHAGKRILLDGGTGSGQERVILSNTSTTFTVTEPWDTIPDGTTTYQVGVGPAVDLVVRSRYEFEFDSGDWQGVYEDDWYRNGTVLWTSGPNAGVPYAIAKYTEATKRITLLIPTAYAIEVGHQAIVRVGCDGLFGTCRDKFDNADNFGGDPYAPSAQQIVEPPEAS